MIKLEPFTESDFDTLISWVKNEKELIQFAGAIFSFPLTKKQLLSYLKMTDKKPYKIVSINDNITIGHCELNFENGNNRLSRILLGDKKFRGKGYCKLIISEMTKMLFADKKVNQVDLNVYDWNKGAINCYINFGFEINPDKTKSQIVGNEIWKSLNMILSKKNWLQHRL